MGCAWTYTEGGVIVEATSQVTVRGQPKTLEVSNGLVTRKKKFAPSFTVCYSDDTEKEGFHHIFDPNRPRFVSVEPDIVNLHLSHFKLKPDVQGDLTMCNCIWKYTEGEVTIDAVSTLEVRLRGCKVWAIIINGDLGERFLRGSATMVSEICDKFFDRDYTFNVVNSQKAPLSNERIEVQFRWYGQQMSSEDYLIVWYMGHGQGDWSFATWDNLTIAPYTLFDMLAKHTRVGNIIIISDSCASGTISDYLTKWFDSIDKPRNRDLLKGGRRITHYHGAKGYEQGYGFYGILYWNAGLSYTTHLHRGLMDKSVVVDKNNCQQAMAAFGRIITERSVGVTLITTKRLVFGHEQEPGFVSVRGPP